jgi:hypothetical protein
VMVEVVMMVAADPDRVRAAQGSTRCCEKRCVGHNRCTCCWTPPLSLTPGIHPP